MTLLKISFHKCLSLMQKWELNHRASGMKHAVRPEANK